MLGQVQIINGVKQIVPLASGNNDAPLGSIMAYYGTTDPADKNWLICDGRDTTGTDIELETHYPSFYVFNGRSNVLPDLRECALVGVGQNATDTIATHDTYTLGQFKDDCFQGHNHYSTKASDKNASNASNYRYQDLVGGTGDIPDSIRKYYATDSEHGTPRVSSTTHGKQKGVNWIMKVTSTSDSYHLPSTEISQVEQYFDEGLSRAQSYSTTETWTGGYWIDGKKIYKVTFTGLSFGGTSGAWTNTGATLSNVDTLVKGWAVRKTSSQKTVVNSFNYQMSGNNIQYHAPANPYDNTSILVIEYTKTS